jgi:hypothetical protein
VATNRVAEPADKGIRSSLELLCSPDVRVLLFPSFVGVVISYLKEGQAFSATVILVVVVVVGGASVEILVGKKRHKTRV